MSFTITSPAFTHMGEIPSRFTCEGDDVSPALEWRDIPEGTRSLALLVVDPDAPDPAAPKMTYVHWILYNIPPAMTGLPEGAGRGGPPGGARSGKNDWHRSGYGGPCPPIGRHRYFFQLAALDTELGDLHEPDRAKLESAMAPHIIARAELVGTYEKRGR